jgi:HEPN domain-containing protein
LSDENRTTSVGLFNYAHTYAASAAALSAAEVKATHWNAPVYFLYFHAVELYLKAFLLANGVTLGDLKLDYRHNARKLTEKAKEHLLDLSPKYEEAINLMDETDNVISSRYLRVGTHKRLPFSVFDDLCRTLHQQIMPTVYDQAGITRYLDLWPKPPLR